MDFFVERQIKKRRGLFPSLFSTNCYLQSLVVALLLLFALLVALAEQDFSVFLAEVDFLLVVFLEVVLVLAILISPPYVDLQFVLLS